MSNPINCPQCGTRLPAHARAGLCPRCVMAMNLASETAVTGETGPHGTRVLKPAPTPAELADKFPQLEILELLGRGGMGAVYKARQKELDRIVALKILPAQIGETPGFAERFTREAKALAKLNHPNIVTLFEFGRADGLFFFLMEYVDGVNLRQLLGTGRIAPREALAIVPQICDALQFAHDQGIVHRDIKPDNILMDRRGRVKVADFGLAKMVSEAAGRGGGTEAGSSAATPPGRELTEAGKVMGTPQYMAPEQTDHPTEVDHRADIYALGVVFYQMLTGELPGTRIEAPSKKVHIDVRLDEIVLRALEKKPELRYQQASVLKTEVEHVTATEEPEGARAESTSVTSYGPWEPTITVIGTGFIIVLMIVAAGRPPEIRWPLFAILMIGLIICGLRLAGIWPVKSPWFPEPNFSSRNLRRVKLRRSSAGKGEVAPGVRWWRRVGFMAIVALILGGVAFTLLVNKEDPVKSRNKLVRNNPAESGLAPKTELAARPLSPEAITAFRAWSAYFKSRTVREMGDPDNQAAYQQLQKRFVDLLQGTVAEPVWQEFEQVSKEAQRAYSQGKDEEFRRLNQEQERLGAKLKAMVEGSGGGVASPAAPVQETDLGESDFAPVIERVLNDPDNGGGKGNRETLKLRTGEQLSVLDEAPKEQGGRLRALVATEGDLFAEYDDFVGRRWAFITSGLKLSDFPARQWDDATSAQVNEALGEPTVLQRVEHSGATLYLLPEGFLPLTLAFETRTGERGLLQVTAFRDNPRTVRVRYKLAKSGARTTPAYASGTNASANESIQLRIAD